MDTIATVHDVAEAYRREWRGVPHEPRRHPKLLLVAAVGMTAFVLQVIPSFFVLYAVAYFTGFEPRGEIGPLSVSGLTVINGLLGLVIVPFLLWPVAAAVRLWASCRTRRAAWLLVLGAALSAAPAGAVWLAVSGDINIGLFGWATAALATVGPALIMTKFAAGSLSPE